MNDGPQWWRKQVDLVPLFVIDNTNYGTNFLENNIEGPLIYDGLTYKFPVVKINHTHQKPSFEY
jgi:hypothetical protein